MSNIQQAPVPDASMKFARVVKVQVGPPPTAGGTSDPVPTLGQIHPRPM